MRPSEALELHRDGVRAILARYPVSDPRVFGSAARGEDTEDSDLDILVNAGDGFGYYELFRLEDDLSALTGVKVDIRLHGEFRPKILSRISRDFRSI